MRDLDEHASAVAHQPVGADGAAMLEIVENLQPVIDDAMRLLVLQADDEADAARVALVQRVGETLGDISATGWRANAFGRRSDRSAGPKRLALAHRNALSPPSPVHHTALPTAGATRLPRIGSVATALPSGHPLSRACRGMSLRSPGGGPRHRGGYCADARKAVPLRPPIWTVDLSYLPFYARLGTVPQEASIILLRAR